MSRRAPTTFHSDSDICRIYDVATSEAVQLLGILGIWAEGLDSPAPAQHMQSDPSSPHKSTVLLTKDVHHRNGPVDDPFRVLLDGYDSGNAYINNQGRIILESYVLTKMADAVEASLIM